MHWMHLYAWTPATHLARNQASSATVNQVCIRNYFCFQPCISSIITWPLIFSCISISPVKLSRLTALTGSLSQCRLFWERIQNCTSSQAWACSQATQPYSLSTMWHAFLWTEVSVSVSSSDTLPGRCEALQGLTYYSFPEGRNPLRDGHGT